MKTRLTPPFLPEEAAELYRRMLLDILAKTGQMADIDRFVFFEQGDGSREYFATLVSDGEVYSQEGDGLGDRMAGAFRTVFGLGYDRVAIIGTDSPDLPAAFIGRAYGLLDDSGVDAVFGPSDDGGYYLLAMKRFQPELFTGIPWSTGEVLERSLERSTVAGIATALLPVWHDIDTAADLLRPELADPANGAPLTREFILRHPPHTPASPDRR